MKKINLSCPVPRDQQPMYEYEKLKNSMFFSWTIEPQKTYYAKILNLLLINYILTALLGNLQGSLDFNTIKNLALNSLIGITIISLFFIRVYMGWIYVYKRLKKATVTYEESGWYDGQTWIKSPDVLIKDTLIADYVLFPVIQRLKITLGFVLIYFIGIYLLLNS